jgi:trans-aconitate methyltransferase
LTIAIGLTLKWKSPSKIWINALRKQHAEKYKATRARYFRKLMKRVHLPRDGVFVDVGCGKGRILLLAVEHGLNRVVGIEISPTLCKIAEKNIAGFSECG